jgi:hypothetical protein
MDKISGIILDVYDDLGGSVLKTIFPTADALPEFVKSAHAISFDERSALPDDAFALILEQGGIELKKFATIDAGNTALSVEYFLKTAHRLPVEAQKVAAQNLVAACGWYDIEAPEELQKVAFGVSTAINLASVPGSVGEVRSNQQKQRAFQSQTGTIATPNQLAGM